MRVHGVHELHDGVLSDLLVPPLDGGERGAGHQRDLVAVELVERQQLSDLTQGLVFQGTYGTWTTRKPIFSQPCLRSCSIVLVFVLKDGQNKGPFVRPLPTCLPG